MPDSRELGVVLTPPKTVEYIISRLGPIGKNDKILDPCVGPGIFVEKLINMGINKEQIFAFDINSDYKSEIEKLGISFKSQDTLLALYPNSYNEYDFIIGNPPYLNKASKYVSENKDKLKTIYGKINAHETYAMFIVNSIWRLKEGGKLGFI
ncbi:MAG: Eco57I restriction-modification methylase domain-containing protein, partial [Promethearchaeota archaeon]